MTSKCPMCSLEFEGRAKYCPACSASLTGEVPLCPVCGTSVDHGDSLCVACGFSLMGLDFLYEAEMITPDEEVLKSCFPIGVEDLGGELMKPAELEMRNYLFGIRNYYVALTIKRLAFIPVGFYSITDRTDYSQIMNMPRGFHKSGSFWIPLSQIIDISEETDPFGVAYLRVTFRGPDYPKVFILRGRALTSKDGTIVKTEDGGLVFVPDERAKKMLEGWGEEGKKALQNLQSGEGR